MARQVADQTAFAASYNDPVRAVNPFTPAQLVTDGSTTTLPVIGVVVLAAALLLMEHLRRKRGR